MNAVKVEQPFHLTVRLNGGQPLEIAHFELCRLQRANNRQFLHEKFAESQNNWTENAGTQSARGALRRTKLDSIDPKRIRSVHWCTNSDRMSKGLAASSARLSCRIDADDRDPEEAKLILKVKRSVSFKFNLRDQYNQSSYFQWSKYRNDWAEVEQYYDDISGTLIPPKLIRAVLDEQKRSNGVNQSSCTTKFREKQRS